MMEPQSVTNITVGTKNLFGGDSDYPMESKSLLLVKRVLLIKPECGSGRILQI